MKEIIERIASAVENGKAKDVKVLVPQAIDEGCTAQEILDEGLLPGMAVIGDRFARNEAFVPEVLVSARAMNKGVELIKPLLIAEGSVSLGKACIGTVEGDLHDIGKNIVKIMFEGSGFEVIDLGVDASAEEFVKTAKEQGCNIIACSSLLTTSMGEMERVVELAKTEGIRDNVKIMVGGAPLSQEFCDKIGADFYTPDAASAARLAASI